MTPATPLTPPRLANDCFALPPGVDWTPVDDALGPPPRCPPPRRRHRHRPLDAALGRCSPRRRPRGARNPPAPTPPSTATASPARASAKARSPSRSPWAAPPRVRPFSGGKVPPGQALRILTGALLPEGVDTVVLEEDTSTDRRRQVAFEARVRSAARTPAARERNVEACDEILPAEKAAVSAPRNLGSCSAATGRPLTGGRSSDPKLQRHRNRCQSSW